MRFYGATPLKGATVLRASSIFCVWLVDLHDNAPQWRRVILPGDVFELRLNGGRKIRRTVDVDLGVAEKAPSCSTVILMRMIALLCRSRCE
jgi:hypothetical protein